MYGKLYDHEGVEPMPSLPISTVRQNLFGLVQQVNDDHEPLTVVTKSGENAVLVAESDWNELMETNYVLRTHGGAQLLKSAQDAREGNTEAHGLIDPDEVASSSRSDSPEPTTVAERPVPAPVQDLLYLVLRRVLQETEAEIPVAAKQQLAQEFRTKVWRTVAQEGQFDISFPPGQIYVDSEGLLGKAGRLSDRWFALSTRHGGDAGKAAEEASANQESNRGEGARRG